MLRFFRDLFVPTASSRKTGHVIAFWSNKELSDLSPILSKAFGVERLDRDYENVWEWLDGISVHGVYVNVSRSHDLTKGDYHVPVIVHIKRNGYLSDEELLPWARILAEELHTEVSIGSVTKIGAKSSEYGFLSNSVVSNPK
jgi:hypothetical protein